MKTVIAVVGATASGKSTLAIQLAKKFDGEIVSCDSVQIYKYFDIGTAKPSYQEMEGIPHYLIDILDPSDFCNAGFWRDKAIKIVEQITARGKVPIIVGGTGLYLKSLYVGMFDQPSRNQEVRISLEKQVKEGQLEDLYQQLIHKDPVYAQCISCKDEMRIVRALEAIEVTQQCFSELHKQNVKPSWNWLFTMPDQDRDKIYNCIKVRIQLMMKKGFIEETQNLLTRFDCNNMLFSTIGYRHVVKYLDNFWSQEEMIAYLECDTRRFAKRQLTFFRSLLKDVSVIKSQDILEKSYMI